MNYMKKKYVIIIYRMTILFVLFISACNGKNENSPRIDLSFDEEWLFYRGDIPGADGADFSAEGWKKVNVPHDWAIAGPFDMTNPSSNRGAYLPGGIGWYRKAFNIPNHWRGRKVLIEFGGIYMNSEVWINDHYLGKRPYGYMTFEYDLTAYLNYGNKSNHIAIRVDNEKQPSSRWYTGSGIYRHVKLRVLNPVHIPTWGTYVYTPVVQKGKAIVRYEVRVKNEAEQPFLGVLNSKIRVKNQTVNLTSNYRELRLNPHADTLITCDVTIDNPHLWSPDAPVLYELVNTLKNEDMCFDEHTTLFGIRSLQFKADSGFFLNGTNLKIKGVCLHHDAGPLGAAVPERALIRQLEILKDMGCNAIRTSHNPPSQEFLDLCDTMGFLVMAEVFDEWIIPKKPIGFNEFGAVDRIMVYSYSTYFQEWYERDLNDFILRDRNHPCIILWSLGNEVKEQGDSLGISILKELISKVKSLDHTRPVTVAINNIIAANKSGFADLVDVTGYNYFGISPEKEKRYMIDHSRYPNRIILGSETSSAIRSRGVYSSNEFHPSSYDRVADNWLPWSSSAEQNWKMVEENSFVAGEFVWTGFDYLGEPSPYPWPARSSFFGIVDLAGFPKDIYYFYRSQWSNNRTLHVFPHWNWVKGDNVEVWCYSNADSVDLFVNGRSLGIKSFNKELKHLEWNVPFEAGELKAIGYFNGHTEEFIQRTTGDAVAIKLHVDRSTIKADNMNLSYVTVSALDADGREVPTANHIITFSVKGNGRFLASGNGDSNNHQSFTEMQRRLFNGKAIAIIQSNKQPGKVILKASCPDLKEATLTITTKDQ